ncbi:MAG TPA: hypothetical protein VJV79_22615 [Polyangiaceae bacterium]|nr:hypothetical protein [Polyangiaceae bacterium]
MVALLVLTGCGAEGFEGEEAIGETAERLDVSRFTGWSQIPPGIFNSAPALVAAGTSGDTLDGYGRGLDNKIYNNYYSTGTGWLGWNTWSNKTFTSKPAATITPTQRFVVARGTNNAIQISWQASLHGSFGEWQQLSSTTFSSAPAIVYSSPYLFVVARKSDNKVYWTRNDVSGGFSNSNWTAWADIPIGAVSSEPAITAKDGLVVVAARGTDNAFWIISTSNAGSTWSSSWKKVGTGIFNSAPAITFHGSAVELAGLGTDSRIWVGTANPLTGVMTATEWDQIPLQTFNSAPAIAANIGSASGKLAVVSKNTTDNAFWIDRWQ